MNYRKKFLLQTIDLLNRTNQFIKKHKGRDIAGIEDVLASCQTAAIQAGECLEVSGKEAEPIVQILEDYCETLYQQSIHLSDTDVCGQAAEKIKNQLRQVRYAIEHELPEEKKEAVFLPYKASMWDSLEDAWLEAKEKDEYDVYVIPIPYFEKNPDGSFGKMYCEADEYPEYVTVTDWRGYDLSKHKPDMIYIHNPYDDWNMVTSVLPEFYSSELKNHTEKLIYIPYFIGVNQKIESHFCVTPGVLYSDQTVVESEEIKKIYIKELKKFEKENHCEGRSGNWNNRIIVKKSGKIERMKRIESAPLNIPDQWKEKIYVSDREKEAEKQKKKVILYNTTIGAFLKYHDVYLKKLKKVLELFKSREDVVLLWRPHPLLRSTIRSMQQDLYEEYMEIVTNYQEDGYGIWDETSDLARAIVLSDAYYGDWSSVVTLYQTTGKPIMIQSFQIELDENEADEK